MIFSRNRFARVRAWSPGVGGLAARDNVSPPYIVQQPHVLNGWQARLDPVGEEWWRDRRGGWHEARVVQAVGRLIQAARDGAVIFPSMLPRAARRALVMAFGLAPLWLGDPSVTLAAMLGFYSGKQTPPFLGSVGNATTDTTQALDTAMSFGVSGRAFAIGFTAPAKTVESALFFATAVGATNSMSCRLRTRASGLPVNPATEETTAVNFSAVGWNEIASFSTALTYATQYYMSLEDGAASTADVTVQIGNNRQLSTTYTVVGVYSALFWRTITANTGWSTQTVGNECTGVVTFSDGTALGNPISGSATQNVAQKGLKWVGGPTEDLDVYGVIESDGFVAAAFTAGQIWSGSNGPGGTADVDSSTKSVLFGSSATNTSGWVTDAFPVRLTGGTDYRVTHFDNAAFTTGARKYSIGTVNTGTLGDLQYCLPCGGGWHWTNESAGAWSDDTSGYPGQALLLEDQVAISGGAGGILRHPGMNGGLV